MRSLRPRVATLVVLAVACAAVVAAPLRARAQAQQQAQEPPRSQPPASAAAPATVAVASDAKFALEEIAAAFTQATGARVELVFGASGTLARQIVDGAPFELFLSADEGFVDKLADVGVTQGRGVLYAIGHLVLFAPTGSPLTVDPEMKGLGALLAARGVTRFAIANPAHAPYGRAAEAALRTRNLWQPLQPFLVLGENVAQATQFATTGNAVGGLIPYALALAPPLREKGTFARIPASDYPALRQRMVLLKRAGPTADRFYRYLQEPAARAVLTKHGFALPEAP